MTGRMRPGPARVVASLGLLWLADALVLLLCAAAAVDTVRLLRDPSGDPESLVGSLLLTVGLVGLLLAGIEVTRAALAATTLRHTHRTRAPWAVRIAALLVGAGGSAAQAAPALSATVITAPANPGAATGGASLESTSAVPRVAPDPRWPASEPSTTSQAQIRLLGSGSESDQEVVVRRGECLWDIVARSLGPRASQAEIAAEWPRWYAANRARIGADPGLIHPGLRLMIPKERP